MKFLFYLIIFLAFPFNAMQFQSYKRIVEKAKDTSQEADFHDIARYLVAGRDRSNAELKAIRQMFRIAVERGYPKSVAVLLPHVPFGVTKQYDELQERLKTENFNANQRQTYKKISGMLLKIALGPETKKERSLLHKLPVELMNLIFEYYTPYILPCCRPYRIAGPPFIYEDRY